MIFDSKIFDNYLVTWCARFCVEKSKTKKLKTRKQKTKHFKTQNVCPHLEDGTNKKKLKLTRFFEVC